MGKAKAKKKPQRSAAAQNVPEADNTPHRNLYVGNLAGMDMTEAKLKQLFEPCGEITLVNLVVTANHTFGFVEFATVADAECAVEKLNGDSGMVVKFARNTSAPAAAPLNMSEKAEDEEQEEASEEDKEGPASASTALAASTARAAAARKYPNPVESVNTLVQLATRTSKLCDCVTYTIEETDLGDFIATLELKTTRGSISRSGEPRADKKDAKTSAAHVALKDPEVHRLLPPLPVEVPKPKAAKEVSSKEDTALDESADVDVDDDGDVDAKLQEKTEKSGTFMSAKKQRQLEQAELRAKKAAKKAAAKAAKAAAAEESEEDSDEEEGSEEEGEASDSSAEEDSSDASESDSESGEDSDDIHAAELKAKKAAIKAALVAKKAAKNAGRPVAASVAKKEVQSSKKTGAVKSALVEAQAADKVREGRMQENFGQTKFIKP